MVTAIFMIVKEKSQTIISKILLFLIGALFGFGLMMAGMSQRSKIYGFLELDRSWDPSLLFVLMTGVAINAVTFNLIIQFVYFILYSGISQLMESIFKMDMEKLI